ncbi:MAG: DIP1984 family protein [Bacteroides sp.]|nr:DIP1984 family protein [Bacteroides sp.]
MKLAEALSRRSVLEDKINELKTRLADNVKVQEGDEPFENPLNLIAELERVLQEFRKIVYRINITNTRTVVDGRSITDMLAERDMLKKQTRILSDTLASLTDRGNRYSRNEIKYVATIDPAELRKIFDQSSAQLRKLDLRIQAIGWEAELLEE